MNKRSVAYTILTLACIIGAATGKTAWASSSQQVLALTEDDYLAEIPVILSASRMSQSITDVSSSITIIDREMIDASGVVDIVDLLRLVPGFQVGMVNGNVYAATSHGLAWAYPRRLLVLIDGRSEHRSLLSNVDWTTLGISLEDIERIEVIRGPNANAYGANAYLGTVNIITRQPYKDNGTYIRALNGAISTNDAVLRHGESLGDFDYRMALSYRQDNGFPGVNDGRNLRNLTFRGNYAAGFSDNLDVQFGVTEGNNGIDATGSVENPVRDRDISKYYGSLKWSCTVNETRDFYIQYYRNFYEHDDEYGFDLAQVFGVDPALIPFFFGGQPNQVIQFGNVDGRAIRDDLEFQYTLTPSDNLRLAVGAGIREDEIHGPFIFDTDESLSNVAHRFFINTEWKPIDSIILNAGTMVEHDDIVGNTSAPKIGINYLVNPNHSFRFNASRSSRIPSLYEVHTRWVVRFNDGSLMHILTESDDNLREENIESKELGYHFDNPEKHISLDMKLFREEQRDVNVLAYNPAFPEPFINDGATVWTNDGSVDTEGLELQFAYRPKPKNFVNIGYAYAKISGEYRSGLNPDQFESAENSTPKHTLSLLASASVNKGLTVSANFLRMSKFTWIGADTIRRFSRLDVKFSQDLNWGGKGKSNISFIVHNLTDRRMREFDDGNIMTRRAYIQFSHNFN